MRQLLAALLICFPAIASAWMGAMGAGSGVIAAGCTASYGADIQTSANAIHEDNEADATAGWTNAGLATFDSITTDPQTGTYHFTLASNSSSDGAYLDQSAYSPSTGTLYRVQIYTKHAAGAGTWTCGLSNETTTVVNSLWTVASAASSWANHYEHIYYNADAYRYFMCEVDAASTTLYLDNATISASTPCLDAEAYAAANAVSTSNETNAVTGIDDYNTPATKASVSTGTPDNGTYHLHVVANSDLDGVSIPINSYMTSSNRYLVSFKIKHSGSGGNVRCQLAGAKTDTIANTIDSTETSYVIYGRSFTYDGSNYTAIRCYDEFGGTNDADFYMDSVSVKEITDE